MYTGYFHKEARNLSQIKAELIKISGLPEFKTLKTKGWYAMVNQHDQYLILNYKAAKIRHKEGWKVLTRIKVTLKS